MGIKRNNTESRAHETVHDGKIICSECGMALKSSHELIMVGDDRALCIFCYKNYMFPNLDENYMELFD